MTNLNELAQITVISLHTPVVRFCFRHLLGDLLDGGALPVVQSVR